MERPHINLTGGARKGADVFLEVAPIAAFGTGVMIAFLVDGRVGMAIAASTLALEALKNKLHHE